LNQHQAMGRRVGNWISGIVQKTGGLTRKAAARRFTGNQLRRRRDRGKNYETTDRNLHQKRSVSKDRSGSKWRTGTPQGVTTSSTSTTGQNKKRGPGRAQESEGGGLQNEKGKDHVRPDHPKSWIGNQKKYRRARGRRSLREDPLSSRG